MTIIDVLIINDYIIELVSNELRTKIKNFDSEEEKLIREVLGLNDYLSMKITNNEIDLKHLESLFNSIDPCIQLAAYTAACRQHGCGPHPGPFLNSLNDSHLFTKNILEGSRIINSILNNKRKLREEFLYIKEIKEVFSKFGLSIFDRFFDQKDRIIEMYSSVEKEFENIS